MAVVAFAVLSVLLFLMTGAQNPFAETATLYTYLGDSAAMTEGSGVRLNGIHIGKIKAIEFTGDKDNDRAIRMALVIERQYLARIPDDSLLTFGAENVLGSKFINIKMGSSRTPIKDGGTLKAKDEKDFLEMVQSAMPLFDNLQSILKRIDKVVGQVEAGEGSIGKLLANDEIYQRANNVMKNAEQITEAIASGKGTVGKLLNDDSLHQEIEQTLKRIDAVIAGIERGEGTAGKLLKDASLFDELKKTVTEVKGIASDLNAGKGTAGKLLKDEALHNRLLASIDKINSTIDRLNAGQGTLGQLMVNPALYENLTGTSEELRAMMKDFRANPKKFLTIQLKLF
jgi:phospholipid/cholesterol/gamma-HCH transport system substrate-binding protein